MIERIIVLIFLLNLFLVSEATNNNLELPDYEFSPGELITNKPSLRERFLERKNKKRAKKMRMKMLNKYLSKDKVYFEGIPHIKISDKSSNWRKTNEIERGIKRIFAAVGVSYLYKRDHFWRTWKKVRYPKKITRIVCYKHNNLVNATCEKCRNTGFWTIEEEAPSCPLEIYSVISPNYVCGANFTQLYNYTKPCPSIINYADVVSSCDNPIKTSYRITRLFKKSKRLPTAICNDPDYCEISTYYGIYKNFIVFKVINSNNEIIYSRIMKSRKRNYACTENCGHDSKKINNTNDKPLSISLLPKRFNKRENELQKSHKHKDNTTEKKRVKKKYNVKSKMAGKDEKDSINIASYVKTMNKNMEALREKLDNIQAKYFPSTVKAGTESVCSWLGKQGTTENYQDNEIDDESSGYIS